MKKIFTLFYLFIGLGLCAQTPFFTKKDSMKIAFTQATPTISISSGTITAVPTGTQAISGTISTSENKATYSANIINLTAQAVASDIFTITGSATKIVKIHKITVTAVRTAGGAINMTFLKRSTANTGGTSTIVTSVSHNSTNAAATAVIRAYTANPTTGALVGSFHSYFYFIGTTGLNSANVIYDYDFDVQNGQPITLIGTNEVFAVNLGNQTVAGNFFDITIVFTEE